MIQVIALLALLVCSACFTAEIADNRYKTGLELLQKVAAGGTDAIVPAAKAFSEAAILYEKEGNDESARSANANLFWIKKRMSLKQIDEFLGNPETKSLTPKFEAISKPVESKDSQDYFDRAEAFANANATSDLLISIRYFEVADRFAGTPIAVEAQRRSLEAMQKIKMGTATAGRAALPLGMAETEYKRALSIAANDYEKAKKAAAEKLVPSIKAAQMDAAKLPNLDVAIKLRDRLKRLQTKPTNAQELYEYLDGSVWDITNYDGERLVNASFSMTFNKNGTFKRSDGPNGTFEIHNLRMLKLYSFDPGVFNDDFTQFWAFGAGGKYVGTRRP